MAPWTLVVGLALLAAAPPPVPETAADAVTLRDGAVVLGQVVEPAPRGMLAILVRRAWVQDTLPDRAKRWEDAEAPILRQALRQRRDRLVAWRRDRGAEAGRGDPITAWIDRELVRLGDGVALPRAPLMVVRIGRGEVRGVIRRPKATARMLRQGWLSGFAHVESMPLNALEQALEGRGFVLGGTEPVAIDRLLPIPIETDAQWLTRRAATEVTRDPGLRFVGTQGTFFPETAPGEPFDVIGAGGGMAALKRLLDDTRADPLAEALRKVAERGRVGATVTRLDIRPDLAAVRVEATLWVRGGADRWTPAGSRTATFRPDDLGRRAGAPLADDPQVKAAFNLVESLGLGPIPDEVKQRSLQIGAATQKALWQARTSLQQELAALALPIDEPATP